MTKEMNMNNVITIDRFNKLTGKETLHLLVGLADLSGDKLHDDLRLTCNFYALLCRQEKQEKQTSLRLINPGETFEIPSVHHRETRGYTGVFFHPDLLCDTPLENSIDRYPTRCSCHSALSEREQQTISDIPFCTHGGSRFSGAIKTIRELEKGATVLDGYAIARDRVPGSKEGVLKWLEKIGMKDRVL